MQFLADTQRFVLAGRTTIFITHDERLAAAADDVLVLGPGQAPAGPRRPVRPGGTGAMSGKPLTPLTYPHNLRH